MFSRKPRVGPQCKYAAACRSARDGPRQLVKVCAQASRGPTMQICCHLPTGSSWPTAASGTLCTIPRAGPKCKYSATSRSTRVGPKQLVRTFTQALHRPKCKYAAAFLLVELVHGSQSHNSNILPPLISPNRPMAACKHLRASLVLAHNTNMLSSTDWLELAHGS